MLLRLYHFIFSVEKNAISSWQNGDYTQDLRKKKFSLSKIVGYVENAISTQYRPIQNAFSSIRRQANPALANALSAVGLGILIAGLQTVGNLHHCFNFNVYFSDFVDL